MTLLPSSPFSPRHPDEPRNPARALDWIPAFAGMTLLLGVTALTPASAAETRSSPPGARPPAAALADLSWMVGSWEGEGLGGTVRESYSPPAGGQMPGHFRSLKGDAVQFYELVMVAQVGASLEYRVKHFNPDLTGWEAKDEVVRFPLVAVEKDAWYFDGLTIRRTGADRAQHFVRIRSQDGSSREASFSYRRVTP